MAFLKLHVASWSIQYRLLQCKGMFRSKPISYINPDMIYMIHTFTSRCASLYKHTSGGTVRYEIHLLPIQGEGIIW